jgi:hypothetical protein
VAVSRKRREMKDTLGEMKDAGRSGKIAQLWFSNSPHVILPILKSPH